MELYADIFLAENLIMNYIVILLSARLSGGEIKSYRALAGAALGAVYALAAFLYGLTNNVVGLGIKLGISCGIIFMVYGKTSLRSFIRHMTAFYIAGFLLAGIGLMLIYTLNINGEVTNGVFYWKGEADYFTVVLMVLFGVVLIKCFVDLMKSYSFKKNGIVEMEICIYGRKKTVKALLDTGNILEEPFSGKCVTPVYYLEIKDSLPEGVCKIMETDNGDVIDSYLRESVLGTYLIPYSSVGQKNGMLLGVKAEYIEVNNPNIKGIVKNCIIGLCGEALSAEREYNALLNPTVLSG